MSGDRWQVVQNVTGAAVVQDERARDERGRHHLAWQHARRLGMPDVRVDGAENLVAAPIGVDEATPIPDDRDHAACFVDKS